MESLTSVSPEVRIVTTTIRKELDPASHRKHKTRTFHTKELLYLSFPLLRVFGTRHQSERSRGGVFRWFSVVSPPNVSFRQQARLPEKTANLRRTSDFWRGILNGTFIIGVLVCFLVVKLWA